MEKTTLHYAHPTGLALSITAGVIYIICVSLVSLWPVKFLNFFNNWVHGIDLTKIVIAPQITIGGFFIGLVEVLFVAYLVGVLYGWLYNLCVIHCKKYGWIK